MASSIDSSFGLLFFVAICLFLYHRNLDSDVSLIILDKLAKNPLKISFDQNIFDVPSKFSKFRSVLYSNKLRKNYQFDSNYDLKLTYLIRHFRATQIYFLEQRRGARPAAVPGNNFEFPPAPFQFQMPPAVANLQTLPAVANALTQNAPAQQNQTTTVTQPSQQTFDNLAQSQVASNSLGMVIDNTPPELYSSPLVRSHLFNKPEDF